MPVISDLGVDDNLQFHPVGLHDPLQRCSEIVNEHKFHRKVTLTLEVNPQVVGIEDLEFADCRLSKR